MGASFRCLQRGVSVGRVMDDLPTCVIEARGWSSGAVRLWAGRHLRHGPQTARGALGLEPLVAGGLTALAEGPRTDPSSHLLEFRPLDRESQAQHGVTLYCPRVDEFSNSSQGYNPSIHCPNVAHHTRNNSGGVTPLLGSESRSGIPSSRDRQSNARLVHMDAESYRVLDRSLKWWEGPWIE